MCEWDRFLSRTIYIMFNSKTNQSLKLKLFFACWLDVRIEKKLCAQLLSFFLKLCKLNFGLFDLSRDLSEALVCFRIFAGLACPVRVNLDLFDSLALRQLGYARMVHLGRGCWPLGCHFLWTLSSWLLRLFRTLQHRHGVLQDHLILNPYHGK